MYIIHYQIILLYRLCTFLAFCFHHFLVILYNYYTKQAALSYIIFCQILTYIPDYFRLTKCESISTNNKVLIHVRPLVLHIGYNTFWSCFTEQLYIIKIQKRVNVSPQILYNIIYWITCSRYMYMEVTCTFLVYLSDPLK